MIIPDKKKAAGLILRSKLGKNGEDTPQGAQKNEAATGELSPRQALAQEILSAMQTGSAMDLASALSAFVGSGEE